MPNKDKNDPRPPKVFISHATEDKDRFVLGFARRLRGHGIDAWLDLWEMYPGDKLVDKIFNEELRDADVIVVVVSSTSINKPWVREELNAATVKRINAGKVLIPVVIDNCEVPEALQSLLWQRIADLNNYSEEFDRIVAAITGRREKPPLGPSPSYVGVTLPNIQGLSRIDKIVLRTVGDEVLSTGDWIVVDTQSLWKRLEPLRVPRQEFEDALAVLAEDGYLKEGEEFVPFPTHFSVTMRGLGTYAKAFIKGYEKIKRAVCLAILNSGLSENDAIAAKVEQPRVIVDLVLEELEAQGLIGLYHSFGGQTSVEEISPRMRRAFRDGA
jgi:hypothetical protein